MDDVIWDMACADGSLHAYQLTQLFVYFPSLVAMVVTTTTNKVTGHNKYWLRELREGSCVIVVIVFVDGRWFKGEIFDETFGRTDMDFKGMDFRFFPFGVFTEIGKSDVLSWFYREHVEVPDDVRDKMRQEPPSLSMTKEPVLAEPETDRSPKSHSTKRKRKPRTPAKQPTREAFAAYKLYVEEGKDQTTVARVLTTELCRPITQGQVSRWVDNARAWKEEGNPWPNFKPQTYSVDPSRLDLGKRENNARRKS